MVCPVCNIPNVKYFLSKKRRGSNSSPSRGPAAALPAHSARTSPTPGPNLADGCWPPELPSRAPTRRRRPPRVFLDSHFYPSRRPSPRAGSFKPPPLPPGPRDSSASAGRRGSRGTGGVTAFWVLERTRTICYPTSDNAGPGCAGPGRGRARAKRPEQAALPFRSSDGGDTASVYLPRSPRRTPPPTPPESGSRTAGKKEGVGGGSRRRRGAGRVSYLVLRRELGGLGGLGRGKGSGEGAGKGGGAPVRCSFGAAPAAATATASFPIHSNKQDGCRYAAALPAAQILGSNRQDVYGQNGTYAPAQPA